MRMTRALYCGVATVTLALALSGPPMQLQAQTSTPAVAIDNDDIGGVVTGPKGPEAGVWVIAETRDLPTRYAKMVVTDDQGRYVVPDLPKGKYKVWVRGYGLVDSPKLDAVPGQQLNHRATAAANDAEAAKVYPAIYWYSMLKIPPQSEFGGSSDIPAKVKFTDWMNLTKNNGCVGCHQLGQLSTRTLPEGIGQHSSSVEAWVRRVSSGQSGQQMVTLLAGQLGGVPFKYYADWTDRIAKGELPHTKPTRPQGVERNIVVTTWDWGTPKQYLHDLIASDRRHPTVNAYGPLIGSPEYSTDAWPVLDPVKHTVTYFKAPVRDANTTVALGPGHAASDRQVAPSPYWGTELVWDTKTNNHNGMIDRQGRAWFASRGRNRDNPDFCKAGSSHPSAKAFPLPGNNRQVSMIELKTMKYTFVDTCFGTHHLQFGYDANETLWTSGGGPVVGWINTKVLDATGDHVRAQGWTPLILDTNGDGVRGEYTQPNQPLDPKKDRRVTTGFYAVMPHPTDGSVWGTYRANPGAVVRVNPGSNPSETALTEVFNVPMPGYGPRGGDIDSQGVVWVSLASGHLGAFDRRKCKGPLNGPKATGDHCPEGWSFYQYPGPGFQGIGENSAESSYYSWVDQHNIFGLGKDVPMSTANLMDGLVAYADGKMISLRVPYPLGFYAKGFDGRIDDDKIGWKGRGLWTSSGDRTPWLQEGGKGMTPMAVHFQLRPNPLAK